jgi:hypothetical protein
MATTRRQAMPGAIDLEEVRSLETAQSRHRDLPEPVIAIEPLSPLVVSRIT